MEETINMPNRREQAGSPATLARETLNIDLGRSIAGQVLGSEHTGYGEACRVWNAMIERRPAAIVRCLSRDDVQRCVQLAGRHGRGVTIRGGGHNIGGRAIADGALMIDFSHQRGVLVDPQSARAEVQPGALLNDVDRATLEHGLVLPTGIVSETGVAGLVLGGGFGWLSRRFGLTCDHLSEAEVVTGTGELVVANERQHPELLWALRGGGGGFGVVTHFRFQLRRMAPMVVAGLLVRETERTPEVAEQFRASAALAPDEMVCMLKLCAAPAAPFLPRSVHGKPVGIVVVCHGGAETDVARDLTGLRKGGAPLADLIQPRRFVDFQAMFDAGEPKGRRDYWKSEYVGDLDDTTLGILLEATGRLPSPYANVKIFQLGGEVACLASEASAAGHRDARFIIVIASAWDDRAQDDVNLAWVRETWDRVHQHCRGGGYINFLTADADAAERASAQAGVDVERLAALRQRFDPDGIFAAGA
jgi:FAD/FMN-containing dehydrogenase